MPSEGIAYIALPTEGLFVKSLCVHGSASSWVAGAVTFSDSLLQWLPQVFGAPRSGFLPQKLQTIHYSEAQHIGKNTFAKRTHHIVKRYITLRSNTSQRDTSLDLRSPPPRVILSGGRSPKSKPKAQAPQGDRRSDLRGALCSHKFVLKCQTIPPVSTACSLKSVGATMG